MRFFFRLDASEKVGTGHAMRCLTLAYEISRYKNDIIFIAREMPKHILALIKAAGFSFISYSSTHEVGSVEDANDMVDLLTQYNICSRDWLIVDHYMIDYEWETIVGEVIFNLMVIDDLANRRHDCKILLDTTLNDNLQKRYKGLVPKQAILLLGSEYALLRQEFLRLRSQLLFNNNGMLSNNILVCFGGTDPTNETEKVIQAVGPYIKNNQEYKLTVILGQANLNIERIQERYLGVVGINILVQPKSMALEMSKAKVAICGGGTMTWERYCLGLPGLVIAVADNQIDIAKQGEKQNIDRYLGESSQVKETNIEKELRELLNSPHRIATASQLAMSLVDGKGCQRVVECILSYETDN